MKIYNCFPGGRYKALTMSYDDGYIEDERLIKIFNHYGIKGTFNLNSGMFEEGYKGHKRVPKERIAELYKGHEVATHCYTHPTIARCPLIKVAEEILRDRQELERLTGGPVRGHAYPNGSFTPEIKELFHKMGVAYARTVENTGKFTIPTDPLEWNPTCHHNSSDLMQKGKALLNHNKKFYWRLMYVWGHSYEFVDDNNWEVIEEFCKLMGGHEDIWYATNVEIIDYLEVLERLKYTANSMSVYNPSYESAWLMIDEERIVEVPGGKCIDLVSG